MQSATFMGAPTNSLQSTITYPVFNLGGAALAAAALAAVGISARAADVNFTAQVTRRLKLAAAIPAIWMVVQILPMPFWSHSIWVNTNEAPTIVGSY